MSTEIATGTKSGRGTGRGTERERNLPPSLKTDTRTERGLSAIVNVSVSVLQRSGIKIRPGPGNTISARIPIPKVSSIPSKEMPPRPRFPGEKATLLSASQAVLIEDIAQRTGRLPP